VTILPHPLIAALHAGGSADRKKGALELEPVLEEVPKWGELRQVLREIQQERAMLRGLQAGQPHPFMRMRTPPACTITLDMDEDELGDGGQQQNPQQQQGRPLQPGVEPEASTMGHTKGHRNLQPQGAVKQECIVISDSSDDEVQVLGEATAGAARAPSAAGGSGAGVHAGQKMEVKDEEHKGSTGIAGGSTEGGVPANTLPQQQQGEGEAILLTEEEAARLRAAGAAPVMVVSREPYSCKQLEVVMRLGGRAALQVGVVGPHDMTSKHDAVVCKSLQLVCTVMCCWWSKCCCRPALIKQPLLGASQEHNARNSQLTMFGCLPLLAGFL
jgi:hypothetical protein